MVGVRFGCEHQHEICHPCEGHPIDSGWRWAAQTFLKNCVRGIIVTPSENQCSAWHVQLDASGDVLVAAETGSGKTGAFGV